MTMRLEVEIRKRLDMYLVKFFNDVNLMGDYNSRKRLAYKIEELICILKETIFSDPKTKQVKLIGGSKK